MLRLLLLSAVFATAPPPVSAGSGGECVGCTLVFGIVERLVEIRNSTVSHELENLCELFPKGTIRTACDAIVLEVGPKVIKMLVDKETPDVICTSLKMCTGQCRLFAPPTEGVINRANSLKPFGGWLDLGSSANDGAPLPKICNLPGVMKLCELIYGFANNHKPLEDTDKDGFSGTESNFRGTYWRGKDCDPKDAAVHPGALPIDEDRTTDSNCNGIFGVNPASGASYESELCGGVPAYGTLVLGDSAAAHFHVPPEFIDASKIGNHTYKDILEIIENEFDWPMLSANTAFFNSTDAFPNINGPVNSSYEIIRRRNRCVHRDYQNLGVNGARVTSMNSTIQSSLSRNPKLDHPLLVMYALIGNDVCNGHPDTFAHMTSVPEYRANVLSTLNYLKTRLPQDSHVLLMGLADGRVLWEGLHLREHPIGMGVTYEDLYGYLNCLEISPCRGWMNKNETIRNMTSAHAAALSNVLVEIAASQTYNNFKVHYIENPLESQIKKFVAGGGKIYEMIEPVDGFHPNQKANALLVDGIWDFLQTEVPDFIPPINPNNAKIEQLFGNQGGY